MFWIRPPKNGEITLCPNTCVAKCSYCVSQHRHVANDKIQMHNNLITSTFEFSARLYQIKIFVPGNLSKDRFTSCQYLNRQVCGRSECDFSHLGWFDHFDYILRSVIMQEASLRVSKSKQKLHKQLTFERFEIEYTIVHTAKCVTKSESAIVSETCAQRSH